MLARSSFIWLLLLAVCCWYSMACEQGCQEECPSCSHHSSEDSSSSKHHSSSSSSEDSSRRKHHSSSSSEDSSSERESPCCDDGKRNQRETDIDCGGSKCAKCDDGKRCKLNRDCSSGSCKNKKCTPTCEPPCQNNGICTDHYVCTCSTGFTGPTCEVQSVGLCRDNETFDSEPILRITFGNGQELFSTATPGDFDFHTTYTQGTQPYIDGTFSLVNMIHPNFNPAWHHYATDHTGDTGGYMYLVNADYTPGQFYNGTVNDLCIGLRYEFSVYLANICEPEGKIDPNVLFEVRSTDGNVLLAQLNSGEVVRHDHLTWEKYGFSFVATSTTVNLLMISNARGGNGNDLVIDDITLRACAHKGSGFCRAGQQN